MDLSVIAARYHRESRRMWEPVQRHLFAAAADFEGEEVRRFPTVGPVRSVVTAHSCLRLSVEITSWTRTHPNMSDISCYILISVSATHPTTGARQDPDPQDATALVLALIGRTWGAHLYSLGHLTGHQIGAAHHFQLFIDPTGHAVDVPAYDTLIPRTKIASSSPDRERTPQRTAARTRSAIKRPSPTEHPSLYT